MPSPMADLVVDILSLQASLVYASLHVNMVFEGLPL
jgi:hypothetical protein